MTTAGDIITGGSSGTPARLAMGSALQHLRVNAGATALEYADPPSGGSGVASGTSFPGAPSSGDLFVRTDIEQGLLCEYDGTRWLGPLENVGPSGFDYLAGTTTTGLKAGRWTVDPTYPLFIIDCQISVLVATTNDGTKYWTLDLRWANAANSETSLGTVTTAADTASNWTRHAIAVNAALDGTARCLLLTTTKTSTPGGIYPAVTVRYRRIFT